MIRTEDLLITSFEDRALLAVEPQVTALGSATPDQLIHVVGLYEAMSTGGEAQQARAVLAIDRESPNPQLAGAALVKGVSSAIPEVHLVLPERPRRNVGTQLIEFALRDLVSGEDRHSGVHGYAYFRAAEAALMNAGFTLSDGNFYKWYMCGTRLNIDYA